MKVAIYARESSKDSNLAPPISNQIEKGLLWIKDNKHEHYKTFQDNGYSGGDWNRPDWINSVNEAKSHKYHVLWVYSQDRLARDTEQFLWYCRNLYENNVKIFCEVEGLIDTQSLGGKVKHTSLAQASEIFRMVTSEKVRRSYQHKRLNAQKQGLNHFWGRPSKNLPLSEIIENKAKGMSLRALAKMYGVSHVKIYNLLKNTHLSLQKT